MLTVKRHPVHNPSTFKRLRAIKVKVVAPGGNIKVTDLILQAGTVSTGWVPSVTEMPWIVGVTNG